MIDDLAEYHDLTPTLIVYWIKITGAYQLYQARQWQQV